MQPVVFSPEWFSRHQRALLCLLNAPVIGREFKAALAIRRGDVGADRKIVRIFPHAYVVANDDGSFTMDTRTHAKYAKRLWHEWLPIWKAAHAWDRYVANPLVPALNVGFDALFTVYPDPFPGVTSCDGRSRRDSVDETWATIIAGAGVTSSSNIAIPSAWEIQGSTTLNQFQRLTRAMFLFDTSPLGSGATVVSATVSLFGVAKSDALGATPDIDLYSCTTVTDTNIVNADFSTTGSTSMTGSPMSYASQTTGAYNVFTLNGSGTANINPGGISRFATRNASYDVAAVAPTWVSAASSLLAVNGAEATGNANDPKLDVTYDAIIGLLRIFRIN